MKCESHHQSIAVWPVEENTAQAIMRRSELQERYPLSFWDALILVAAAKAYAQTLLSEDLNHA